MMDAIVQFQVIACQDYAASAISVLLIALLHHLIIIVSVQAMKNAHLDIVQATLA